MTRKIDEHVQFDVSEKQYEARHRAYPKSLDEQDVEWERSDRLEAVRAQRAVKRGRL